MDNLIYSLNATVPVFVVIVAGYIFKKIGWINDGFIKASNKLTFTVTLPLLLIQDMMNNDFLKKFDLTYVLLFCYVAMLYRNNYCYQDSNEGQKHNCRICTGIL